MEPLVSVGLGYDIHRLVDGRPLKLGGVTVPFERGLSGHSDADVVLHAIADALLGGAGLPDIGETFPETDPAYKDADSRDLLARVVTMVRACGLAANHLDVVVHAERPRLADHKRPMRDVISLILDVDRANVSIKAKTAEGLGDVGAGRAIACTAVVGLRAVD